MHFITYCLSPTGCGRTYGNHQGVLKNSNKTYNKRLICTVQVKRLRLRVNILGAPCYNTKLVYI